MSITLEGVTYRYPGTSEPAIKDVHLRVSAGQVLGLAGANESGKSTVCLLASGLAPSAIGGDLHGAVHRDAEGPCALLMQNPQSQLSTLHSTVFEEVAFGPCNHGLEASEVITRVEESLAALGISHLAGRHPERLSGGEIQLVALAGAIGLRPDVLVLDTPAAYLDHAALDRVRRLVRARAASGVAVLVAEHRTDFLAAVCDRLAVIADGRIAEQGAAAALLGDPRLASWGVVPLAPS
jgi:energy-coupling factor transporter ATP-binding protein EcfA2